jgi:hypothetical protein
MTNKHFSPGMEIKRNNWDISKIIAYTHTKKGVDYYVVEQQGGGILVREDDFAPLQQNQLMTKTFAKQDTEPMKKRGRPKWSKNVNATKKLWRPKKIKVVEVKPVKKLWRPKKVVIEPVAQVQKPAKNLYSSIERCVNKTENTHDVQVFNLTGHEVWFPNSKKLESHWRIRISENDVIVGYVDGIPIYENQLTPSPLPKQSCDKIYIVSNMVCLANPDRDDLYIPHRVQYSAGYCLGICKNPYFISANQHTNG